MDENKSILRDQTLLTGSSGFLGSIINRCSEDKLLTLGRSYKDILKTNLTEEIPILPNNVSKVIHCMGLAHFEPKTNQESNYFFKVNYDATVNLTKAIDEHCENLKQFIFISSVSEKKLSCWIPSFFKSSLIKVIDSNKESFFNSSKHSLRFSNFIFLLFSIIF